MAGRKICQRFGDLRQQLDGVVFNRMCETSDLPMQLRRNRIETEPFKRIYQRVRKTMQAVAVLCDTFALDVVKNFPHLLWGKFVVIEERNEFRDGSLEVDIVLPQRIVGVDKKVLRLVVA